MFCRYSGRSDCGCTYEMTASLLSENHDVIEEFKEEPVTLDPERDDCSWKQVQWPVDFWELQYRDPNARMGILWPRGPYAAREVFQT